MANNPTSWIDPSGHGLDGYAGTLQFLPVIGIAAFALAASLSTQIALTLAAGQKQESWQFGNNISMTIQGLTTFAMVLRCALTSGCQAAKRSIDGAVAQLGSASPAGITAWPPESLTNAWSDYPAPPVVVEPAPAMEPGPASPQPDPGSDGPPGWFWPAALLAALGTWAAHQYFSPMPARCQHRDQRRRRRKIRVVLRT